MKKVIMIASVLAVAVVSTACINNLAVQDLNNKAKAYADKGDYTQAIERLKSSIDLDPSIFETHYNLAIVYTKADDYINAISEYKTVINMKPDLAEAYYALATAENNLAIEINKHHVMLEQDGTLVPVTTIQQEDDEEKASELTDDEKKLRDEYYESAIKNYRKYISLAPNAKDKNEVLESIARIEGYLNPIEKQDTAED